MSKKIITFLDPLQRCIFGEHVVEKDTETLVAVKNPVVVNVVPQADPQTGRPTGQMVLQLIPIFFREFLADKDHDMVYLYNKTSITVAEQAVLDFKLLAQYEQIFTKVPVLTTDTSKKDAGKSEVIKLFDE